MTTLENTKKSSYEEEANKFAKLAMLAKIGNYVFLVIMAIIVIFPFYWMINTSLMSEKDVMQALPPLFPTSFQFANYITALDRFKFGTYLVNTLLVAGISTIGTLFTTVFAAYAFAKMEFKGKSLIFSILLGTMMIPGEMMVITNFITVSNLGWLATYSGQIAAMTVPFFISVFYIFLLRQNFMQIPNELYLAAKVDGKGDMLYLWKVMLPLCKPTIITIVILKVMGSWNSYVWPNLISTGYKGDKNDIYLITNGLRGAFSTTEMEVVTHLQMAATVMVTVPLLVMFLCFRKYIMHGVSRSGIKG